MVQPLWEGLAVAQKVKPRRWRRCGSRPQASGPKAAPGDGSVLEFQGTSALPRVGEGAESGSPPHPARDPRSGGHPCLGTPALSLSRPGQAVWGKGLGRAEVGPKRVVPAIGLERARGWQLVIQGANGLTRKGTPGDDDPGWSSPGAAHPGDTEAGGQQIPRGVGGRWWRAQGGSLPTLGSACQQAAHHTFSRSPASCRPSLLPSLALGRLPMSPLAQTLLQAPPRPSQNWGQPSGASLCLFAPLGSSCSPRFPDPALRSPAQRDGGLTCIVCWLEGLSSPWARRDLPCQGERVPGVQEKVTRRGILPGFVAFAPGSLLTAPPGPTVHPFPHRGELKKVGKGH